MNEYRLKDLTIGLTERFQTDITEKQMAAFYAITGDENPLHRNLEFAQSHAYDGKVVYGMLTASFLSTLAGVYLPGKWSLIHSVETKFVKPVFIGDKLTISGTVKEINTNFGFFDMKVLIINQNGEKVCRGQMRVGMLDESE